MVYWTAINQEPGKKGGSYYNESFRARHGYKEMHVHNAPPRKNKDFRPTLYGHFRGMLNFKLAEPWALMRHFNDLFEEEHQFPIQLIKSFIKGAAAGTLAYLNYSIMSRTSHFADQKLYLTSKEGIYRTNIFKIGSRVLRRPALLGGSFFVAYHLIYFAFIHHKEAMNVPEMVTHFKVWSVMAPLTILYLKGPKHILSHTFYTLIIGFPIFYMIKELKEGQASGENEYSFYQKGVTQAEKDKIEYQDHIEEIAFSMQNEFAYGLGRYKNWDNKGNLF